MKARNLFWSTTNPSIYIWNWISEQNLSLRILLLWAAADDDDDNDNNNASFMLLQEHDLKCNRTYLNLMKWTTTSCCISIRSAKRQICQPFRFRNIIRSLKQRPDKANGLIDRRTHEVSSKRCSTTLRFCCWQQNFDAWHMLVTHNAQPLFRHLSMLSPMMSGISIDLWTHNPNSTVGIFG